MSTTPLSATVLARLARWQIDRASDAPLTHVKCLGSRSVLNPALRAVFIISLSCAFVIGLQAQTVVDCPHPSGCVVISRDAALKALDDADARRALEAEIKVKDQAYANLKDTLNDMRVEFARSSGENTILKQQAVRDLALIELFSKMVRPKKIGLNIF